jgi:putative ABC transport system permease protein
MMKILLKYIRLSWVAIKENRGRSFLTMLGIIIGVGAVVLMTSLGRGAESLILGSVSSLGSNLIYIIPGSPDEGLSAAITAIDRIKYRDYLYLKKVDFLENVTPFLVQDSVLVYGEQNEKAQVHGTNNGYTKLMNFYPEQGRFIEDFDISGASRVIVLGYKLSDRLFGDQNPLDKEIKIKGLTFRVIGIMEPQGGNAFESWDDMAFMPVTAMQTYLFGVDYVQNIMAGATGGKVDDAIVQTREVLRRLHNIDNPEEDPAKDDFTIMSQAQALGIFTSVSSVLTLFIVMIASISLLVGGIGIMNIMYVSVNQRTREIGLRKAVGATRLDVLLQFLVEASSLTLIGGLLGVAAGLGMSFLFSLVIVRFQPSWQFLINEQALVISLLVSILIGVVFGIYPARKASLLDPIEALRYE